MPNQYVNKMVLGSETIFDLSSDTISADKILSGFKGHDKSGAPITGTCAFDVNSTDGTAAVAEILATKTAYARGSKLTGTMPNNGKVMGNISTKTQQYTIPLGYHDGSGKVGIVSSEQAKLIPANIKAGVELLGITGEYGGEEISAQTKSVTPSMSIQQVLPDEGFDYLSQVTVAAIPVVYTDNAAGGKTVTIG